MLRLLVSRRRDDAGPLIARFHTNADEMVGYGFLLQYRLNHCFFGGKK